MVCMIIAMLLLPVGDTLAKLLTEVAHPLEVVFFRLASQSLFLMPIAILMRKHLVGSMFTPVAALSGILVACTLASITFAFAVLPIPTVIAIFFVEPLVLTLLARLLLREQVQVIDYLAIGVGLCGALMIIRPGYSQFGPVVLLPLISAVSYALNMIVLRRARTSSSSLSIQCGATVYATVGMLVLVLCSRNAGWIDVYLYPSSTSALLLVSVCGASGAASFLLIAAALERTSATKLAPLQYLEIVGATAAGYLVFAHLPDVYTAIGVVLIFTSGALKYLSP